MFLWCMLYGLKCMLYAVWCMGEVLGFRRRVSRAGESITGINILAWFEGLGVRVGVAGSG